MNKEIMKALGFSKHVEDVEKGNCPFCHKCIIDSGFRDELSLREYRISGLCQACQDDTFKAPDEDDDYIEYEDHYYPDEL